MATLQDRAARRLWSQHETADGLLIAYRRGNEVLRIRAVRGVTEIAEYGVETPGLTARLDDWLIDSDALVFDGGVTRPEKGDEITWEDTRGEKHMFRAMPIPGGRCYRFTDQSERRLRIHTKEVVPT